MSIIGQLRKQKTVLYLVFSDSTSVDKFLDSGHERATDKCSGRLGTLLKEDGAYRE